MGWRDEAWDRFMKGDVEFPDEGRVVPQHGCLVTLGAAAIGVLIALVLVLVGFIG